MPEIKNPLTTLEEHLDPDIAQEVVDLYNEGIHIDDDLQRKEHIETVAELAGELVVDFEIADALMEGADQDRKIIEKKALEIRTRYAKKDGETLARQRYVEPVPRFTDQVVDESRINTFRYAKHGYHKKPEQKWIEGKTEAEGLQQLYGFLADFVNNSRQPNGSYVSPEHVTMAKSLLENLSFIGEKEYQKAIATLGAYWKQYLDEDSDRQICALAPISYSENYPNKRKSDDYLRDRILDTFSDEELAKYSGRIVGNVDDLSARPKDAKVIILDDWSISGGEMRKAFTELSKNARFGEYMEAGAVEANLLIASERQLEQGIRLTESRRLSKMLPVRAHYASHYTPDATFAHVGHIAGAHSVVNYDFENPIKKYILRKAKDEKLLRGRHERLALTYIVPEYRTADRMISISKDSLSRIQKEDDHVD